MFRLLIIVILLLVGFLAIQYGRSYWSPIVIKVKGKRTLQDAVKLCQKKVDQKLRLEFVNVGLEYPPKELLFQCIKETKQFELWGRDQESWKRVKIYPILGASGTLGPKLREGDRQVPEGIYRVIGLNPNSSYHLSMKLNYPNSFDLKQASIDGRFSPGSDIFIHGKDVSVGCLAMGDEAIEELFLLAYLVRIENIKVLIAPRDPRDTRLEKNKDDMPWVRTLYQKIESEFLK